MSTFEQFGWQMVYGIFGYYFSISYLWGQNKEFYNNDFPVLPVSVDCRESAGQFLSGLTQDLLPLESDVGWGRNIQDGATHISLSHPDFGEGDWEAG